MLICSCRPLKKIRCKNNNFHFFYIQYWGSALFFSNKTPTKSKCGHFFFLRSFIKINLLALGKRKVVSFPRIPVIVADRSEDPFRKHLWYSLILNVEKVKIVIFASYFFLRKMTTFRFCMCFIVKKKRTLWEI
jgi:hypothetical protein